MTTHQDCGDVIYLIPVERCRASMSTSVITEHMVNSNTFIQPLIIPKYRTIGIVVYELYSTH